MMRGKEEDRKIIECCMCGDSGLSHELLLCKSCRFRSQHRYCSNIYPNSDSYDICNWCLIETPGGKDKYSQSLSKTPSSFRIPNGGDMLYRQGKADEKSSGEKRLKRVSSGAAAAADRNGVNGLGGDKRSSAEKKNVERRRNMTRREKLVEETVKVRKSKSEETSNEISGRVIVKNRFRNRVRRYKFLDEVSN